MVELVNCTLIVGISDKLHGTNDSTESLKRIRQRLRQPIDIRIHTLNKMNSNFYFLF